jgi:RNA polymerase sigma factor (sigma-70 family)
MAAEARLAIMMGQESEGALGVAGQPLFATTHWSVVLAARNQETPEAAAALEQLCCSYWQPLYVYVRRRGYGPEDAQDLTQQFLAQFLSKGGFGLANPARGRFRTFLLNSLQHFLTDEWKRARAIKRGGGKLAISLDAQAEAERYCLEMAENLTPERAYERRWAMSLLEEVLAAMKQEYEQAGKGQLFRALQSFVWGPGESPSYAQIATDLGVTEGAARVAVHRLREQYRQRLRAHVAQTVDDPGQVEDELRYLIEVMS